MKYEEIMDRIEVTPEMRQRVLSSVEAALAKKKRQPLRRLFALAACLAVALCCWFAWKPKQVQDPEQGMLAVPQIDTMDSLQTLIQKTGIPLKDLIGIPFAVEHREYTSYWEELAEIQYVGKTDTLCYRKSKGTEDNSGDCNVYPQEKTLNIAENTVTLKGEENLYTLAAWTDGSYAYSISVTTPISQETFTALIEANFAR